MKENTKAKVEEPIVNEVQSTQEAVREEDGIPKEVIRAIIEGVSNRDELTVTIPLRFYSRLLADSEKLDAIVRCTKSKCYVDKDTILLIADQYEEEPACCENSSSDEGDA